MSGWRAATVFLSLILIVVPPTDAAEQLQHGVFYFSPANISVDNFASGRLCTDADGSMSLCEKGMKILISGDDTCDWPIGQENPCTHFGYEFAFSGAQPGTSLECDVRRYNPQTGEQTVSYRKAIDSQSGQISHRTFRTFAPVAKRVLLSEVHDCSYLGEKVATIEYMIVYEPGVGEPEQADNARVFERVPDACASPYLTENTAIRLLQSNSVNRHVASEHIPVLQSQCIYGAGSRPGQVGYVFKFMLSDMFDLDKLSRQQVDFNAQFANGGHPPNRILDDLGARAYVFSKGRRLTLFVITGHKGSKDSVGREREFVAQYSLNHPEIPAEAKLHRLMSQARSHLHHWAGD